MVSGGGIIAGLARPADCSGRTQVLIGSTAYWRAGLGYSVTEVTTILTALTILSGAAAPAVTTYLEDAKLVRARSDVRTVAISLVRLMSDVGPERNREGGWAAYDILAGGGLIPAANAAPARNWAASGDKVGSLDDHLITNAPEYPVRQPRAQFGWRGAYIQDPVSSDPWGQRYAVNVAAMKSPAFDTVALSAGPDGIVESVFERDGLPTAGDDIAAMVSSSGLGR
jgi:hypothetical protein